MFDYINESNYNELIKKYPHIIKPIIEKYGNIENYRIYALNRNSKMIDEIYLIQYFIKLITKCNSEVRDPYLRERDISIRGDLEIKLQIPVATIALIMDLIYIKSGFNLNNPNEKTIPDIKKLNFLDTFAQLNHFQFICLLNLNLDQLCGLIIQNKSDKTVDIVDTDYISHLRRCLNTFIYRYILSVDELSMIYYIQLIDFEKHVGK